MIVGGLTMMIGAALLGAQAGDAVRDPVGAIAAPAASTAPQLGGSLVTAGYPPVRIAAPPEREHGTDGLIGWFPFRELYASAGAAPVQPGSVIFWNRKAAWQVDVYAR